VHGACERMAGRAHGSGIDDPGCHLTSVCADRGIARASELLPVDSPPHPRQKNHFVYYQLVECPIMAGNAEHASVELDPPFINLSIDEVCGRHLQTLSNFSHTLAWSPIVFKNISSTCLSVQILRATVARFEALGRLGILDLRETMNLLVSKDDKAIFDATQLESRVIAAAIATYQDNDEKRQTGELLWLFPALSSLRDDPLSIWSLSLEPSAWWL
jgi:hypothetical protein